MDIENHADRRFLLQACEVQGSELSTDNGKKIKANKKELMRKKAAGGGGSGLSLRLK